MAVEGAAEPIRAEEAAVLQEKPVESVVQKVGVDAVEGRKLRH